jgi:hypothetical protein
VRIVVFLSVVFLLLTVSIAGGIIANDTSSFWAQKATGENTILIANSNLATQYTQLMLMFSGGNPPNADFNYSDPQLALSDAAIAQVAQVQGVANVDARLIWSGTIQELSGYTVNPDTLATVQVGDSRQCSSIMIGVDPETAVNAP